MGTFQRRIVIAHRPHAAAGDPVAAGGRARAALEDDFHHFRIDLRHDGERVQQLDALAIRHPYSLCPWAAEPLQQLVGMPLDKLANAVTRRTEASQQCTHLLDLAGLAIAAAANGRALRRYEIAVPDRVDGVTRPTLDRDGQPLLQWQLHQTTITGPDPYTGIALQHGFARWALQTLSADDAEAALVLRRGAMISLGRMRNLDALRHAEATGRCHVQQPQRAALALRMVGSTHDFSARSGELCSADAGWLDFRD